MFRSKKSKGSKKMTITNLPRSMAGGFGDRSRVTLKYNVRLAMTSSTIGVTQIFRGNSLYDPDQTGVGLQPINFDDFMVQYHYYCVLGSTIRIQAIATAAAPVLAFFPSHGLGTGFIVSDSASQPYAKHFVPRTTGGIDQTWQTSMTTSKILGVDQKLLLGDSEYGGTSASNPTQTWYWVLTQEAYDNSTSSVGYYMVQIEYDTIFFEREPEQLDLDAKIKRLQELKQQRPPIREQTPGVKKFAHFAQPVHVTDGSTETKVECKAALPSGGKPAKEAAADEYVLVPRSSLPKASGPAFKGLPGEATRS